MDKRRAMAPDPAMDSPDPHRLPPDDRRWSTAPRLGGLLGAALLLGLVTLGAARLHHFLPENVSILLFLTAVLVSAAAFGFWVGIASALGAIAAFNFLFVEPHFTLLIARPQDLVTLAVFLLAAGLTGILAGRLREQVDAAKGRAAALEVVSRVSGDLAGAASTEDVARIALRHLHDLSQGPAAALASQDGQLRLLAAEPRGYLPEASDLDAADVAFRRGRAELAAARGWSGARLSFYPLGAGGARRLVLGHARLAPERRDRDWRETGIEVVLRQAEQALQRLALAEAAEAERRRAAAEETRAALLASLSHDLRTPLATILGAVTTLRELGATLPPASQADLLAAIEEESGRLARYVEKLLQLTRLQSGIAAQMAWVDAGDVVQAAVARARRSWPQAQIAAELAPLPMIRAEAGLLEQAVFNLVENAVKYAPGPIRVTGAVEGEELVLTVADGGRGLPPAIAAWLASDQAVGAPPGTGLGLPICKGIARALGGRMTAAPGGTALAIWLPVPRPEAGSGA
ncbi:protein of unknown function [Paracoccus aminovorans]|uniref:histidine kinase n=1 Tax=Paracoccus aminovorans TaxID=34004 RepID=A0A1I2Z5Q4_9RHOB|nr:DUF4118 domain-containing protein [Paracoccus aminovorans]CQR83995.1 histidine kinase [Paracoccus aminovorans]SFH33050.1 protein of unknown function [Paracoccus aminovorans]